ncbi:MAG: hypothetical protein PVJ86_03565, partial [Phycisphaerales bacterium]
MSIEWLLTKAPDSEAQKKPLKGTQEDRGLSDKVIRSKPKELNWAVENGEVKRQPGDKYSSS